MTNNKIIEFSLSFEGNDSEDHQIDLYDVSQALVGFQRTIALTTNLMMNGDLITQAPSLKNAIILAQPPEEGSWKICATVLTSAYFILTAPKETVLGNLVYSAYDYIIKENLGFHPKLDDSLVVQYENYHFQSDKKIVPLNKARLESLAEKCQYSVKEMHRPIYGKQTALTAKINCSWKKNIQPISTVLDMQTYNRLIGLKESSELEVFAGRISSYDANTQKGRIFLPEILRTIPFELQRNVLTIGEREHIIDSLKTYQRSMDIKSNIGFIKFQGYRITNQQNDLKKIFVVSLENQ